MFVGVNAVCDWSAVKITERPLLPNLMKIVIMCFHVFPRREISVLSTPEMIVT